MDRLRTTEYRGKITLGAGDARRIDPILIREHKRFADAHK